MALPTGLGSLPDSLPQDILSLPGFTALDVSTVLRGRKRGASVQLDETYFGGQLEILQALDSTSWRENRIATIQQSAAIYDDINVDFELVTEENLWEASRQFRTLLQRLPEISALKETFPGHCFVVPEWLRTSHGLQYGARVYFFRSDDSPAADEILRTNIDSVLADDRAAFERYQGSLHGYPECCIEFFHDRTNESNPELLSVDPLADAVDDELLDDEPRTTSLDRLMTDLFDTDDVYRFFTRCFYPEPTCETASKMGRELYDDMDRVYPTTLVRDYFRLNYGFSYLVAQKVEQRARGLPRPGALGREHRRFYLPLHTLVALSRYH